jgi:hypothetical protein
LLKCNTHPIPLILLPITSGPKIKSALKGRIFQDTEDIQKNVTMALKAIPHQEFQNISNSGNIVGQSAKLLWGSKL